MVALKPRSTSASDELATPKEAAAAATTTKSRAMKSGGNRRPAMLLTRRPSWLVLQAEVHGAHGMGWHASAAADGVGRGAGGGRGG